MFTDSEECDESPFENNHLIPPPVPPTPGAEGQRGSLRRRMSIKSGALSPGGGAMRQRARRTSISNNQPQVSTTDHVGKCCRPIHVYDTW